MGYIQWQVVPQHIQEVVITVFDNAQLPGVSIGGAGEILIIQGVGLFHFEFLPPNR